MTDTQNNQPQTNQPADPIVAAPAQTANVQTPAEATPAITAPSQPTAQPAQDDKFLQEVVEKVVSNCNGFKNFMGGLSTKALYGIALASFLTLYFAPDCRGLRAHKDIYSNGSRQPSGIAINKNGVQSIMYCETPELLNELKVISQREGISLDNLVQKVDTERPYGKITEFEVSKYVKKN